MPNPESGVLPASRGGGGQLAISTTYAEEVAVLTLRGELDLHTVPRLRTHLAAALEQGDGPVVVDLCGVTFIDSSGLASLLNALRRMTRAGRRLVLTCGAGPVRRILQMTRLDSTFSLYPSVDDALDALLASRAVA